jgi:exonuclease III
MLEEFLWKQDIDLALVQEVTTPLLSATRRYTAYMNEGKNRKGTAILAKEGIPITDIKRIPSGRGMAAMFNGTRIINIYGPSGAENKNEREMFYNNDLTYPLPTKHTYMILAGDFNCILANTDSTGTNNYSRALANIVHGFDLIDTWDVTTERRIYTQYTSTGAFRIDRTYVTRNILSKKQGVETIASAFTDHFAVVLRIAIDTSLTVRGRGYWRMNVSLLSDTIFHSTVQTQWAKWKTHMKFYPNSVMWWVR